MWAFLSAHEDPKTGDRSAFFQRYFRIQSISIPVSSVSYALVKRVEPGRYDFESAKKAARSLAEVFSRSGTIGTWTEEIQSASQVIIFRADSPKQNRFFQLFVRNLGDRLAVSTSSTRRLYIFPVAAEAAAMQQTMMDAAGPKAAASLGPDPARLHERILEAMFPSANAQVPPGISSIMVGGRSVGIGGLGLSGLGGLDPAAISRIIGGLGGPGGGAILTTVDGVRMRGEEFLRTARGEGEGFLRTARGEARGFVNESLSSAEATARRATDYAGNRADLSATRALDRVDQISRDRMADVNRTVTRLTSTSNILRMAFAAGVGSTVGSLVANTAINFLADGVAEGVSLAYHLIMGTMSTEDRQRIDQQLGGGLAALEQSSLALTNIERGIDQRIAALMASTAMQLNLDRDPDALDNQLSANEIETRRILNAAVQPGAPDCTNLLRTANQLRRDLVNIQSVIGPGGTRAVCAQIQDLLNQWVGAELAMHNARNLIANNWSRVMSRQTEQLLQANATDVGPRRSRVECERDLGRLRSTSQSLAPSQQCLQAEYRRAGLSAGAPPSASVEANARTICQTRAQQEADAELDQIRGRCRETVEMNLQRDRATAFVNGLRLTAANQEIAQQTLLRIAQSDCEEGSGGGVCDGRAGAFRQIRDRYAAKFAAAGRFCPELVRPNSLQATERPTLAVSGPVDAAPVEPAAVTEGPGWVRRQWTAVSTFFSSMFS